MENSICITGIKRRPGDRGGRSDLDPGRTDRTCDHLQITAYQSGADNIRKDYQRKFRNLSVVSTGKKEMTTGYVRRGNGISDTDIYSACLACTCVDGKRIHPDGKELQKGRYEPGSGVRICRISKRTSGTL